MHGWCMRRDADNTNRMRAFFFRKFFLVSSLSAAFLSAGCTTAPSWNTGLGVGALAETNRPVVPPIEESISLHRLSATESRPAYRLGPQDELNITIWGNKDIWSEIRSQGEQVPQTAIVQDDGTLVLPLLENVSVAGLTVPETLAKIADAYKRALRVSFQVDGWVTKYRSKSIWLDGMFNKPGVAYLNSGSMALGEVVNSAGGLQETGDASSGVLVRGDKRYAINYQDAQQGKNDQLNIELLAGDRIFFPSRSSKVYYVFGEVGMQGAYPIPSEGITLLQGLGVAKGANTTTANLESIFLIRSIDKDPRIYQLNLADILATQDLALDSGDRIFVPPTGLTNWERTFRQLIPIMPLIPVAGAVIPNP